jgi:hypothetical protein
MSATIYWAGNAAAPTTAAPVKVATGTAVKTLLQIATPATATGIRIVQWGISFDTPASASIVTCELFGCTGAASVGTALTPSTYNDLGAIASQCQVGAALTCFSPGTEGTVANYRPLDWQLVVPPAQYVMQWPLGREPQTNVATFIRVRVTATVTCNALCYVQWEE